VTKEAFETVMAGLEDTLAYGRGDRSRGVAHQIEVPEVDVREVRSRLGLTQSTFAGMLRVSVATVREWERGRRRPEGPARVLLKVIAREPDAVRRALAS
jgi:putative transcriptional regulator